MGRRQRAERVNTLRMQSRSRVERAPSIRTFVRQRRFRALAILAAALLLVAAFVPSAFAQGNTVPANGQPEPPTAAAPPAPPPAAAPSAPAGEHSVASAELPQDLTPWGMFLNAGKLVQAVIIGLAFASLVTWTVFVAKTLELRSGAQRSAPGPAHPQQFCNARAGA